MHDSKRKGGKGPFFQAVWQRPRQRKEGGKRKGRGAKSRLLNFFIPFLLPSGTVFPWRKMAEGSRSIAGKLFLGGLIGIRPVSQSGIDRAREGEGRLLERAMAASSNLIGGEALWSQAHRCVHCAQRPKNTPPFLWRVFTRCRRCII